MSYMALYRKFRPTTFEDVKGQDHIVTTLKNQIKADRIGHAYLFCGTRGTGKTTIAKIFAKAVNCEHPIDGSPCGECASCRSIAKGSSMNVIEIDAASNNGVDNIRQIREEVAYSPTEGKYKVYIIDEVHMLSTGAFNALLKTLEEPPAYVIFILATTEAYKIPVTVLSRCQRYDFHRISIDTIAARLNELLEKESVQAEEKAVRYIAKAGDGSMRDALSLLDQSIAFYLGETLTYDKVLDVLGVVDTEVFSRLLRQILDKNISGVIELLEELVIQGRELGQFVNDFTWYLRNLLLMKSAPDMEDVLDMSSENLALLKEETELVSAEDLYRFIRIFSDLSGQLKYSTQKRILLEVSLIRLCCPQMESTKESLVGRIEQLEKKIESGNFVSTKVVEQPQEAEKKIVKTAELPKAIPEEILEVTKSWSAIIKGMDGLMYHYLKQATVSLGGENRLIVVFDDETAYGMAERTASAERLQQLIAEKTGRQVEVQMKYNDSGQPGNEIYPDLLSFMKDKIHMDITIED
ncbi:MAG: DNA polymerase III subunit gamma/tau [Lachnospiraceae bacterium]